jgi:hypothetical protein
METASQSKPLSLSIDTDLPSRSSISSVYPDYHYDGCWTVIKSPVYSSCTCDGCKNNPQSLEYHDSSFEISEDDEDSQISSFTFLTSSLKRTEDKDGKRERENDENKKSSSVRKQFIPKIHDAKYYNLFARAIRDIRSTSRLVYLKTNKLSSRDKIRDKKGRQCKSCHMVGHLSYQCWFTHPTKAPRSWLIKQVKKIPYYKQRGLLKFV